MSNIVLHEIDVLTVIHDRLIALIMIFLQRLQITRNKNVKLSISQTTHFLKLGSKPLKDQ